MMVFLFPCIFLGWKFMKKTKRIRAHEADLVTDLAEIEEYTRNYVAVPETNWFNKALDKLFG